MNRVKIRRLCHVLHHKYWWMTRAWKRSVLAKLHWIHSLKLIAFLLSDQILLINISEGLVPVQSNSSNWPLSLEKAKFIILVHSQPASCLNELLTWITTGNFLTQGEINEEVIWWHFALLIMWRSADVLLGYYAVPWQCTILRVDSHGCNIEMEIGQHTLS